MVPYLETGGSNISLLKTVSSNGSLFRNEGLQFFPSKIRCLQSFISLRNGLLKGFFTSKLIVPKFPYLETGGSNGSLLKTVGSKGSLLSNGGLQSFPSKIWLFLCFSFRNWWFQLIFRIETDDSNGSIFRNWWFQYFPS